MLNKDKMHDNAKVIENYDKIKKNKDTYVPGLFGKPSLFIKNKLKETPIQRQSL